ncbi:hypothetical protein O6H91_Y502500 [Diphasiastrum complanatum]|nr:hypothetical protein O6H91_Y502500 [Diphasiastrum complanatum]
MSQEQPSQQDRGLFGLFGGKKDEHQQQHGTTGDNTTDQGHGSHVSTGTEYGTGAVDQGAGSHTGYGTGVGHVSHTPDTGYNAAAGEYTTGAPNATHPGGEEKKHGLLGKLHKSGSSSSSVRTRTVHFYVASELQLNQSIENFRLQCCSLQFCIGIRHFLS